MILLITLLACRDEQLAPLAAAADAYDDGKAAFDKGSFDQAVADFGRARALDPTSPVLALWQARALAAKGDLAGAESAATEVVAAHPDAGLGWYNRAAYRAREGHHDAAAADLQKALELHTVSALQAAADPDFRSVLNEPAYARLLPRTPVVVAAKGPSGSVFVGSDVELEISVSSAPGLHFSVTRTGLDPGCLVVRSIVEERQVGPDSELRTLKIRARAVGPCVSEVGPFVVAATTPAVVESSTDAIHLEVEAPASFEVGAVPPLATQLFVPFEHAPSADAWAVGREGEFLFAIGRADVHPTACGAAPDVTVELREDAGTRAAGGYWRSGPCEVVAGEFRQNVP